MWMEEHIGKRVNHERVEEALDTGASKIATGCPFCRVMMTDGVDDVAAANDIPKAEVLDVAQLLLGSLDKSSVTLPEKGAAAKEAAERAPAKAEAATVEAEPEAKPEPKADAGTATESKPVTGLGIAGGAKRPGAKKSAPAEPAEKPAASCTTRQGTRHRGGRQATRRQEGQCAGDRSTRPCRGRQGRARGQGTGHRGGSQASRRQENARIHRQRARIDRRRAGVHGDRTRADSGRAAGQGAGHRAGCTPSRRQEVACPTRSETRCAAAGTGTRRRIRRCA